MTDRESDLRELIELLRRYGVAVDRYADAVGAHQQMHRTDLNALSVIMDADRADEPLTPGRLGAALHLSPPATTALLDRLEGAGHVLRRRSGTDRRRVHLVMTGTAHAVAGRMFGPLGRHIGEAAARYTPEQRALIARFLRDVTAAVETAQDAADTPT